MLENYLPILIFLVVGLGFGGILFVLGYFLGPNSPDEAKQSPYECGFDVFEDARDSIRRALLSHCHPVHHSLTWKSPFSFPGRLPLREIGMVGFWAMMLFLAVLVVGFVYEWRKGALEWE